MNLFPAGCSVITGQELCSAGTHHDHTDSVFGSFPFFARVWV